MAIHKKNEFEWKNKYKETFFEVMSLTVLDLFISIIRDYLIDYLHLSD